MIELLVVIAVIGLLASIVIVNLTGTRSKANIARGLQFSQSIHHALGAYAVGVWSFNEGSGTTAYDASGYGNNGTLTNGPVWKCVDTPSGSGCALQFDGVNDYVDCGNNASLNPTTAITMEAWVKFNTLSSIRTIASTFEAGGYGLSFNEDTYPNKIVFLVRVGGSYRYGVSNDTPNISKWYHLVGTYDGTIVKLYINGLLQTFVTNISGVIQNSIHTFQIASNPPGSNFFSGSIDEVRIYEKALETTQVESLYYAGLDSLLTRGLMDKEEYQERLVKK